MNSLIRTSVVMFIVGLIAFGVISMRYTFTSGKLWQESRRGEETQHWLEVLELYRENQYQAVREWMAQRCTLAETMQRFQELEWEFAQQWPPYRNRVRQSLPLYEEEPRYLLIRERLESILHGRPEELTAIRLRLAKDYQQLRSGRPKQETAGTGASKRNDSGIEQSVGAASSPYPRPR